MGRGQQSVDGTAVGAARSRTSRDSARPAPAPADVFRTPETEENLWRFAPYVVESGQRRYAVRAVGATQHYDRAMMELFVGHGRGYTYDELAEILGGPPWGANGHGLTKRDLGGKSDKRITAEDIRQDLPDLIYRLDLPLSPRREPNPRGVDGAPLREPASTNADGTPELDENGRPKIGRIVQGKWRVQLLGPDAGRAEIARIKRYHGANHDSASALREIADGAAPVRPPADKVDAWAVLGYLNAHRRASTPIRSEDLEAAIERARAEAATAAGDEPPRASVSDGDVRAAVAYLRSCRIPVVWEGRRGYGVIARGEVQTPEGRARLLASADSLDGRSESQEVRVEDLEHALGSWWGERAGRRNEYVDRRAGWEARRAAREHAAGTRKAAIQQAEKSHRQTAKEWAGGQLTQYEGDRELARANASLDTAQRDRGFLALAEAEAAGRHYGDEANHHLWSRLRDYREYVTLSQEGWLPTSMRRPGSWHDTLSPSCWRDVRSAADKRLAKAARQAEGKRKSNERVRRSEEGAARRAAREAAVAAKLEAEDGQRRKAGRRLRGDELGEEELAAALAARS